MWRTEYDECGGYDMMSGAYKIISPTGYTVCVVDAADHQWDEEHRPLVGEAQRERAKGFAELIVRALNAALALDGESYANRR